MTENVLQATDLQIAIWNEFREMPGLRVTLRQLCRLVGRERAEVARALEGLADAGVVRRIGPYYMRADLGNFTA
jgi:hypothetical protein